MGEDKAIRVGDNLQEDVHVVKNGGESWVLAIVLCDLVKGKRVEGQSEPGWASAMLEQWTPAPGLSLQSMILNGKGRLLWVLDTHWARAPHHHHPMLTFFANQIPLAWVTHSRE